MERGWTFLWAKITSQNIPPPFVGCPQLHLTDQKCCGNTSDQTYCTSPRAVASFGFRCVGLPLPSFIWHSTGKPGLLFSQMLFNLIQLLLEVLAGALHHFYFMEGTLHRKARRHPTLLLFFEHFHVKCIWSWQPERLGSSSYPHNRDSVSSCHESPDGTSSEFALGASIASQSPPFVLKHVGLSPGTTWASENFIFAIEGEKDFDQRSDAMCQILILLHCCQTLYLSRMSCYGLTIG